MFKPHFMCFRLSKIDLESHYLWYRDQSESAMMDPQSRISGGLEPDQEAERHLVVAAIDGSKPAFSQLIRESLPQVFPVAYSILGNRADAEDAIQEAVISAMDGINGLRDPAAFTGWFRVIVANRARGMLRKRANDVQLDDNPATLIDVTREHELSIDLRDAIGSLPEFHQQAILLYYSGLKTREVANALERPRGTVQRVLSEAYRMLRERLGPDYDYRNQRNEP